MHGHTNVKNIIKTVYWSSHTVHVILIRLLILSTDCIKMLKNQLSENSARWGGGGGVVSCGRTDGSTDGQT
jgi:hypothetical protein